MIKWLKESDRYKHLLGGLLIGLGANTSYCAAYAGIGVASALELKDKLKGGKWDWIDFICTILGVAAGYAIHYLIVSLIWLN